MKAKTLSPARRITIEPTSTPPAIPPQIPRPPSQISMIPAELRVVDLAPARGDVVEARADDPAGDAPHRDAQDEVPLAALPRPQAPGQEDRADDPEEEHEAVRVERQRPELDLTARGARESRRSSVPTLDGSTGAGPGEKRAA